MFAHYFNEIYFRFIYSKGLLNNLGNFPKSSIILRFTQKSLRSEALFNAISKGISTLNLSYWKQTSILIINPKLGHFNKFMCITSNEEFTWNLGVVCSESYEQYSIVKKSFVFLNPCKSSCSYYDSSQTGFNSSSHKHCIRQSLKNYREIKVNCSCFILKNVDLVQEIIGQTDNSSHDFCLKDERYVLSFYDNYSKLCTDLCPIDCIHK